MPTSTFFRLPEEKRQRLIDAAWEEFSRISFSEASINRIIQNAHIPRGSFYQYFADKEDLFWYLLSGVRERLSGVFQESLEGGGDLFAVPVRIFDRVMGPENSVDPGMRSVVEVMRLNQGMDFQRLVSSQLGQLPDWLIQQLDRTKLKKKDLGFLNDVFFLILAPLAFAIMETLRQPNQWERQRELLLQRLEIIKCGSLMPAATET